MATEAENYQKFAAGSEELVNRLVEDHLGWTASIARSVARAWNLDWELDGLNGGANEALLFCSRRFDPTMGVPFRAYARRRIHEASTEVARKCKTWQKATGANSDEELTAREISAKLLDVFPELRDGVLPINEESGDESIRGSIRQLLSSASVIACFQDSVLQSPESAAQFKQVLEVIADLDPVHQSIVWGVYWNGQSMRSIAEEWKIDELAVIREHKEILRHISESLESPNRRMEKRLKVRPGLRTVAQDLRKKKFVPPFAQFAQALLLMLLLSGESLW